MSDLPEKNQGGYYTVRIRFSKVGSLQYISHLDLIRTLSKVLVRARFPLWYTEGFNPKPKISYAAPLSVGTESLCEYMDLRFTEYVGEAIVRETLNRNLTDEMRVFAVYYPQTKLTELTWLSYEIRLHTGGAGDELAAACRAALSANPLIIRKQGKAGEREVDIRPAIRSFSVVAEGGELLLRCVLRADSAAFLNPEHLLRILKERCGVLSDPVLTNEWYTILRTEAYNASGEPFV